MLDCELCMPALTHEQNALISTIESRQAVMIDTTRRPAEINSGSYHVDAINTTNAELARLFGAISEFREERELAAIPLVGDEQQARIFTLLKECGEQLNLDIAFKPTGGCCEGNNLAAAGLVNIAPHS